MSGYTDQGVGFRSTDTSLQAAIDMGDKAGSIRDQVLACLHASVGGLTADQIAERIGRHYGSVRPRVTELGNDNRLRDSGLRRKGAFGKMQIVWELA